MTISLWFMAWTPYLIINFTGIFGAAKISPLGSIWGSVFAKCMALYNPIVYGISHPKYRAALVKKYPGLTCASSEPDSDAVSRGSELTTTVMEEKPAA
jgi:r-opsin